MPMKKVEQRFLPGDDAIEGYEASVIIIARRRFVKTLFRETTPIPLDLLLKLAKISINSAAAIYNELKKHDYIQHTEFGFQLTAAGRTWAVKERKSIFMHKSKVRYHSHGESQLKAVHVRESDQNAKLPKKYSFSFIDMQHIRMIELDASSASEGESPFG